MSRHKAWPVWIASAVLAILSSAILSRSDILHRWNDLLVEKYSSWLQHEESADVAVIGIDSYSLEQLNSWPWPRGQHAKVLDFLRDAAAKRVFVDIDFSSNSSPEQDDALEQALSRWGRGALILPMFLQPSSGADTSLALTRPLPRFARHATLASVNLLPDGDSIVRVAEPSWDVAGVRVPSVFTVLSGRLDISTSMPIDYSIAPGSFSYYSYVDVLRGRVALEELRGKSVLIGATALELGDMQPVPVHRSLPGVVIHALATQTAQRGAVSPVPAWVTWLLLACWTLGLAWLMARSTWLVNLATLFAAVVVLVAIGLAAYGYRLRLEVLPLVCSSATGFVAVTLASLDAANLRAHILSRLANKRRAVLDSVFASSYDGILWVEQSGAIISANNAAQALLAGRHEALAGKSVARFLTHPFDFGSGSGLAAMNGRIVESEIRTLDDRMIPVEVSTMLAEHEEGRQFTLILRDLRERRAQEARLRHQATHDALTGLPNRFLFLDELSRRTEDPSVSSLALLSVGLTRFKEINDTLGHGAGDTVLCAAAARLEGMLAGRGMIGRLDGEGFVILAECDGNRERLLGLVRDLGACLRSPFDYEGIPIGIGANIGVACYPKDGTQGVALLKNAGIAMYCARSAGDDMSFYDPGSDRHSVRRLSLIGELPEAIRRDTLELHYQPKVALRTGQCTSVEALLRWNHPAHGFISPGELIPWIETTEMLRPLTEWTIRTALAQHRAWLGQGVHVQVAVNLSARLLQDAGFPDRLAVMLESQGVHPGALELEITESAMLLDPGRALTTGRRLRELGVSLSVDDYGTGHSSLAYLRDLSVSALKLDRTFVEGLEGNPGNRVIVESTLALAHALRLDVVAEGIETAWQSVYLRELGYDFGQGFFFSPALDAEACLRWIQSRFEAGEEAQSAVA